MSSTILIVLVAGGVVVVFLLLAALAWGIRTRREEENFSPAPDSLKPIKRTSPGFASGNETVPDWMPEPEPAATVSVPSVRIPTGMGLQSPFGDLLRNAVPQLASVMDLGKLVQQMQASGETIQNPDERNAAIRQALDQMIEQQPDNELLLQIRDSIGSGDESEADEEYTVDVEVVRIGGRNVIRAGGTDYYSLMDIPDPDVQAEARRLLLEIEEQKPS
jgi:hypothetical protein